MGQLIALIQTLLWLFFSGCWAAVCALNKKRETMNNSLPAHVAPRTSMQSADWLSGHMYCREWPTSVFDLKKKKTEHLCTTHNYNSYFNEWLCVPSPKISFIEQALTNLRLFVCEHLTALLFDMLIEKCCNGLISALKDSWVIVGFFYSSLRFIVCCLYYILVNKMLVCVHH